jgi:hypothetical protein
VRALLCLLLQGLLFTTAAAAAPAAARAAGPWGAPLLLTAEAGTAALAVNPQGQAIIAYGGRGTEVMAVTGSPDGRLGSPVAVLPDTVDGSWLSGPEVVIGPAGESGVVTESRDAIRVAWKGPGSSFAAQAFPGYDRSTLNIDRYGNAGLTLVRDGADGLQHISVAWRRPGARSFGQPREVAVTRGGDYAKVLFSDAGAMVVWSGAATVSPGPLKHMYAAFGSIEGPFSPPVIISDPSRDADRGVTGRLLAESNARGDVIVAWTSGLNAEAIDVATRRAGGRFVTTRFSDRLARPSGGVSPSGTFLVGFASPFGPIEVHRDSGRPGGFQRVDLPPNLTTADIPAMGIDSLEDLQIIVATGARYDHLGTHSVLADGTVGAFDEIAITRAKRTNPNGTLGFDARGHGWAIYGDHGATGGWVLYASRYDASKASAVRAPSISAVRYRRAARKPSPARSSARSRRQPVVTLTLSKTARLRLSARCARKSKRKACKSRTVWWKVRGKMGANRIALSRSVARRLRRGTRYRLTVTARDSRAKLSRPKHITFRR